MTKLQEANAIVGRHKELQDLRTRIKRVISGRYYSDDVKDIVRALPELAKLFITIVTVEVDKIEKEIAELEKEQDK